MITNEKWELVKGYTRYEVSNTGKVRNRYTLELKATRKTKTGYMITDLKENGKKQTRYIHRLVAIAFIENPNNLPCINHKDENKENNCVDNLEWCTVAYNNKYGDKETRQKETMTAKCGKKVAQIDIKSGEVVAIHKSLMEAAKCVGVTHQAILLGIAKPTHTIKGYKWEVVE